MTAVNGVQIPTKIDAALKKASSLTGVDFKYLLNTASRESSFKKDAKANNSSATGLFQFIESTWLKTVKDYGAKFGLEHYSKQILTDEDGRHYFADPAAKNKILSLRNDPEISALMAGAYANENVNYLKNKIGREPTSGELYIAHFLGPRDAVRLVRLLDLQPTADAEIFFANAASKNKSVFYENGKSLTISELYSSLISDHETALKLQGKVESSAIETGWTAKVHKPGQAQGPLIEKANFQTQNSDKNSNGSIGIWGHIISADEKLPAENKNTDGLRGKILELYNKHK